MSDLKKRYEKNGWVGPLEIMTKAQALEFKKLVDEIESKHNLMNSDYRCKSNVLYPFVDQISRWPKLVEYLTEIIGPNFHCWDSLFWIKRPGEGKEVSFHQDATYWNFDKKHLAITAWFAFDDVDEIHGGIEYVTASHTLGKQDHVDIKTRNNLLMRGQTVKSEVAGEKILTTVPAGHVLLHSPYIVHGSKQNLSNNSRIALGMIFVPTICKPVATFSPESTIMISGVDNFNHMLHDPRPTGIWEVDLANWQKAYDRQHENYYRMEQVDVV